MAEILEHLLLLPKDMDALKHLRQPKLFMSLKRDLALVSSSEYFTNSGSLSSLFSHSFFFLFLMYSFVAYMQAIQEVTVTEEWVKDTRNEAKVKANLCVKIDRALGAAKQKNNELSTKMIAEKSTHMSVKVGLKNAQDQVEDQRKRLYRTEIELATTKQQVLELSTDLKKAKVVAQMAEKAAKASKQAFYKLGVQETEV